MSEKIMNFIEIIKSQLTNPQNHRGVRDNVIVNTEALSELIYHFEAMDSKFRLDHYLTYENNLNHNLSLCVEAHYKEFKDGEKTMLIVMDSIKKLIDEKIKLMETTKLM